MNQDLTKQLAEWQAQAAELAAKIADAQEALAKPTPWERWKPADGESYFFVHTTGGVGADVWTGEVSDRNRFWMGNVHQTCELAQRHAKRLRSMAPTCPVPKVGQQVYRLSFGLATITWAVTRWEGALWQKQAYNLGHIFATEEAANAWIGEYADAWTTVEDAS